MLINRYKELNFTFWPFWIFRHAQHVTQMFVICHRQTQRPQRLIRHRTQFITGKISQFTTVQTAFNTVIFHHPHHRAPPGFRRDYLLTHFVIIPLQLTQPAG